MKDGHKNERWQHKNLNTGIDLWENVLILNLETK
jgi:hypothetical protein